jgi:hypothetical protein
MLQHVAVRGPRKRGDTRLECSGRATACFRRWSHEERTHGRKIRSVSAIGDSMSTLTRTSLDIIGPRVAMEPCKLLNLNNKVWRREWDSDSGAFFRFCNLQIARCQGCRRCQRCRRALHRIAPGDRSGNSEGTGAAASAALRSANTSAMNARVEANVHGIAMRDQTCARLNPAPANPTF